MPIFKFSLWWPVANVRRIRARRQKGVGEGGGRWGWGGMS